MGPEDLRRISSEVNKRNLENATESERRNSEIKIEPLIKAIDASVPLIQNIEAALQKAAEAGEESVRFALAPDFPFSDAETHWYSAAQRAERLSAVYAYFSSLGFHVWNGFVSRGDIHREHKYKLKGMLEISFTKPSPEPPKRFWVP
ncbi:MAG: hypothetical protein V4449_00360 [Patescibacteria group bacterium]